MFGAGFFLGTLRVLLLVPRLGTRWAELLEMPFMLVAVTLAARWVVGRWHSDAASRRLAIGALALLGLFTAELGVLLFLRRESLAESFAARDLISTSAYLASLVYFGLAPLLWGRRERS